MGVAGGRTLAHTHIRHCMSRCQKRDGWGQQAVENDKLQKCPDAWAALDVPDAAGVDVARGVDLGAALETGAQEAWPSTASRRGHR